MKVLLFLLLITQIGFSLGINLQKYAVDESEVENIYIQNKDIYVETELGIYYFDQDSKTSIKLTDITSKINITFPINGKLCILNNETLLIANGKNKPFIHKLDSESGYITFKFKDNFYLIETEGKSKINTLYYKDKPDLVYLYPKKKKTYSIYSITDKHIKKIFSKTALAKCCWSFDGKNVTEKNKEFYEKQNDQYEELRKNSINQIVSTTNNWNLLTSGSLVAKVDSSIEIKLPLIENSKAKKVLFSQGTIVELDSSIYVMGRTGFDLLCYKVNTNTKNVQGLIAGSGMNAAIGVGIGINYSVAYFMDTDEISLKKIYNNNDISEEKFELHKKGIARIIIDKNGSLWGVNKESIFIIENNKIEVFDEDSLEELGNSFIPDAALDYSAFQDHYYKSQILDYSKFHNSITKTPISTYENKFSQKQNFRWFDKIGISAISYNNARKKGDSNDIDAGNFLLYNGNKIVYFFNNDLYFISQKTAN